MTIENKLKEYILSHYKSIREFTNTINMPYSTMDNIFRRGIKNTSVHTIIKIGNALNISVDELANDRIIPNNKEDLRDMETIISFMKLNASSYQLTIDNVPLTNLEKWQ